jgi:hypothetical protein
MRAQCFCMVGVVVVATHIQVVLFAQIRLWYGPLFRRQIAVRIKYRNYTGIICEST